jgi:hypothetical protein
LGQAQIFSKNVTKKAKAKAIAFIQNFEKKTSFKKLKNLI